jgi:hypothetical protein
MPEVESSHRIIYKYVGDGGYIVGVPARNLTIDDLQEIESREGISQAVIRASKLYEKVKEQGGRDGRTESVSTDSSGSGVNTGDGGSSD